MIKFAFHSRTSRLQRGAPMPELWHSKSLLIKLWSVEQCAPLTGFVANAHAADCSRQQVASPPKIWAS